MSKYWEYFKFGSFVLQWVSSAAVDGKIDKEELLVVVTQAVKVFGKDIKIDLN